MRDFLYLTVHPMNTQYTQMKSAYFTPILLVLCTLISVWTSSGCKSTQKGSSSHSENILETGNPHGSRNDVRENDDMAPRQLSDLLRTVPGLNISGSGTNTRVLIRGMRSFEGPNAPLYVVDGTPLGRDYNSVSNSINVMEVESIRVLKGTQAALYGSRGSNGVILIKMKKD